MAKYMYNGKIVSGTRLIEIAREAFRKEPHGIGGTASEKITTHEKAYWFLTSEINREKRPSVKWWSARKGMWMGF